MFMKKIGSEKKIDNPIFKVKVGTVDKKKHNVIYIEGGAFIMPITKKNCYNKDINNIESNAKKKIGNLIKNEANLDNNYIFKFEIPDNRLCMERGTFLSFQIFFKYKDNMIPSSFKDAVIESKDIANKMLEEIKSEILSYNFSINKKRLYNYNAIY